MLAKLLGDVAGTLLEEMWGFFVSHEMFLLGDEIGIVTPVNESLGKVQKHQQAKQSLAAGTWGLQSLVWEKLAMSFLFRFTQATAWSDSLTFELCFWHQNEFCALPKMLIIQVINIFKPQRELTEVKKN